MNRRGLLAMVHCAKKDLGLDEDAYREALHTVTGHRSARDINDGGLGRVVDHFRRLGWKPKSRNKISRNPSVRKVWALWGDLHKLGALKVPGARGLRPFCKNLVGIEDPEWMSPEQLNKVIESLKVWQRRAREQKFGETSK